MQSYFCHILALPKENEKNVMKIKPKQKRMGNS